MSTRPIGVVSKKLTGLRITARNRLLCKVDDAFSVSYDKSERIEANDLTTIKT